MQSTKHNKCTSKGAFIVLSHLSICKHVVKGVLCKD